LLGPSTAEGRFEARQAMGLTPLVGREEEFALLLRRCELAKDGEGQVVRSMPIRWLSKAA
jgi:hypothetical protein